MIPIKAMTSVRSLLRLGMSAALFVAVLVPAVAQAAPPPNDDFDTPKVVGSLPYVNRMNPREATSSPDDPRCNGRENSVWYSFTPARPRWIRATTDRSQYDTVLSAWTGTRGNLTQVACDDESGPFHSALITIRLRPGVTYYFMIGSNFRSSDLGRLVFSVERARPACLNRKATIVGTDGDDTITGTRERDVIVGLEGDDTITGRGGRDVICGSEGNDSIQGDGRLQGEDGNDTIVVGTDDPLRSRLHGGTGDDRMVGGRGPDVISGATGSDELIGGAGVDLLVDESIEADEFSGGRGPDELEVGEGDDVIDGGAGSDFVTYGEATRGLNANLTTGVVTFEIFTQAVTNIEGLKATEVPDTIVGSPESDELWGGGGVDTIDGGDGNDYINGGDGGSFIVGGDGDDQIFTRERPDDISGGSGRDLIYAGGGDDLMIDGGPDDDVVFAGGGNDSVVGGDGDDELYGARGKDGLMGGLDDDVIRGMGGDDQLDGEEGVDWLHGGRDEDLCIGETRLRCEA